MSFLSGGFFGGGTNDTKQKSTTTTTTTTDTQTGDIGLTGNAAVDLVDKLSGAAVTLNRDALQSGDYRTSVLADSFNNTFGLLDNSLETGYTALVGGAQRIIDAGRDISHANLDAATTNAGGILSVANGAASNIANSAQALLDSARDTASRILPNDAKDSAPLIYAALAVVAVLGFIAIRRR